MPEGNVLTVGELLNKRVFAAHGKRDSYRRIGKVRRFVFHPSEKRCIGFVVKRPDVALMFHRPDLFVAIDRIRVAEAGIVMEDEPDAVDRKACGRLGVDWEKCLLWLGMEIVTEDGRALGRVGDVAFEAGTGRVVSIRRDEGATARWLLGVETIPAQLVRGFRLGVGSRIAGYGDASEPEGDRGDIPAEEVENCGAIVVSNEVEGLDPEGGLAERAGAVTAKAAHRGKEAFAKAREQGSEAAARVKEKASPKMEELGEKAESVIDKGAFAAGRQIGRAKGMFSGLVDEYRKALNDEDDEG